MKKKLELYIKKKSAVIGVIGLGYVGLPTAGHYIDKGFKVIGFDTSNEKINRLKNGKSYIKDISDNKIQDMLIKNFYPTEDKNKISEMDVIFICVPTPIDNNNIPDLSYIETAVQLLCDFVKKGTLIILESSSYPGTTEEYICSKLKEVGHTIGESIFVGYSPERIDPGNHKFSLENTPKIVSGVTKNCQDLVVSIIGKNSVLVSDVKIAEMTKIYENTFRWINIAFVNETAMLCHELGIDIWEVIEAANTKPYGFMKFEPGIGVGGHCIPVDPYYFTYLLKQHKKDTQMIELAGDINSAMLNFTYTRIMELIKSSEKENIKIIIFGISYKPNIGDLRESPFVKLVKQLEKANNIELMIIDPLVKEKSIEGNIIHDSYNALDIQTSDLTILGTVHSCFDLELIFNESNKIFDIKNVLKNKNSPKVIKL